MSIATWTLVSLLVHVPVVVAWIGLVGLEVFLCTVRDIPGGQRLDPIAAMRWPTVALLLVIIVTGIWQTMHNPFVTVSSWQTLEKLKDTTNYGMALFWKHGFVIATVVLSLASRFVIAPRALLRGDHAASGMLRVVVWLNLLACLMTLLATTRMTITLH